MKTKKRIVDTNVAVIANGRNVNASADCQKRAISLLGDLVERGCVSIDSTGAILTEYNKRLHAAGQPGVGDLFYRHILDNQGNAKRVKIHNTEHARADALRDAFSKGSLDRFHIDDRCFAFCGAVARVPVSTATDSDWTQHESGLSACGVQVEFVCGRAAATGRRR